MGEHKKEHNKEFNNPNIQSLIKSSNNVGWDNFLCALLKGHSLLATSVKLLLNWSLVSFEA